MKESQEARGFIYFENKKLKDVENVFKKFTFDKVDFCFFSEFKKNNKIIKKPGVYFSGDLNIKYTKENIVRLLRKLMKLENEQINFNFSISNDDVISDLKKIKKQNKTLVSLFFKDKKNKEEIKNILESVDEKKANTACVRDFHNNQEFNIALDLLDYKNEKTLINNIKKQKENCDIYQINFK